MDGLRRANSGEERYLVNSDSHAERERGGRVPVRGRHSVMLRLF